MKSHSCSSSPASSIWAEMLLLRQHRNFIASRGDGGVQSVVDFASGVAKKEKLSDGDALSGCLIMSDAMQRRTR